MKRFPEKFLWGGALSGPQSEGRFRKKHANIFDYWYETAPEDFHNFVGPDTAANLYHDYEEDFAKLKEIGFNSLRTSIQWSRLIDDLEEGTINEEGAHFYHNLIDAMIANGIEPMICLYHFDLPIELYQKYGGWESKKIVELFCSFARTCFKMYGDKVNYWFVFNEPKVSAEGQYLFKYHYPKLYDSKKYIQSSYHFVLATAKVIEEFRSFSFASEKKIGTVLNLTPAYPASDCEEDQAAAAKADLLNIKFYLDPAVHGNFPEELISLLQEDQMLWESTQEERDIISRNQIDLLGVNYYHPERVKAPDIVPTGADDWYPNRYFNHYQKPGRKMNIDKGWEVYPEGLYDIALLVKEQYGNIPWFVSENGMGISREERFRNEEKMIADDYRIAFFQEHLECLHRGIEEGSNCFGYHMWTPIDNWSWKNAFRNRYGLISTNVHTQEKTIKKSGYWFKEVIHNNGIPDEK